MVALVDEGDDEDEGRKGGRDGVLQLPVRIFSTVCDALAPCGWVGDAGGRVTLEEALAIGNGWRVDGVSDRSPERTADEDECQGRPERVSDEAVKNILGGVLLGEAAERSEHNGDEGEVNEGHVVDGPTLDEDTPHAAEEVLPENGVTLVETFAEGTGGLEGLGLATEPLGKDEGSENAHGDVGRHPELVASTTTTDTVTGWHGEEEFADTVADVGGETGADQPAELLISGESDKWLTHGENDGDGEHGGREQDRVQVERTVEETGEALSNAHLTNILAPKTELELDVGIDGTNSPTSTLLQMATEILRHSTKLQSLMDISRLPALSEKLGRSSDILSQGTEREVSNLLKGVTTGDVAGSSAPGDTHGVLDGLDDVDEEIQGLGEWVGAGGVVEELGRAGQGDFGVGHEMRQDSAKPARLRNHISVEGSHVETRLAGKKVTVLQTIVQVTSLEMVRNTGDLGTGHVEQVRLVLGQLVNLGLERLGLAIIENNDLEPVKRVILSTSSTNSVHDNIVVLSAASDEHIDSGHIIT